MYFHIGAASLSKLSFWAMAMMLFLIDDKLDSNKTDTPFKKLNVLTAVFGDGVIERRMCTDAR